MSHSHKDRDPKRVSKTEANLAHCMQYSLGQPGLIKPAKIGLRSVLEIPVMTNRPQVTGYRIPQAIRNAKCEKRGQNCEIGREMRRETPVLADVAETATSNVESAKFRGSDGEREDHDQRD